jgi:hypothetical protein
MNDPYKWLTDFFENRKIPSPMRLEFMIPGVFERYFLIHENYGIIDEYPFTELPEGTSEQEQEKRYKLERSYVLLLRNSRNPDSLYRPISLKELAGRFNTQYSADMLDVIKGSPGLSPLWERTADIIKRFIQLVGKQEPLFLYIHDYFRFPKGWPDKRDEETKERTEIEDIQEYINFLEKSGMDACSYLFGKEHPWCLATFEDFPHFILGCENEIAEQLTLVDGLEYFEISGE